MCCLLRCAALLCAAALCYANNCQHLFAGLVLAKFHLVFYSCRQRLPSGLPLFPFSYLPPSPSHTFHLPLIMPSFYSSFYAALSLPRLPLPASLCLCVPSTNVANYLHTPTRTHLAHTPTIALAFAQCRGANSEPRHITKFRTVCNCNAAAADAASSNTANVPKKAWRVQNANGRASCPIDSWPRGVRERGEGGRGSEGGSRH